MMNGKGLIAFLSDSNYGFGWSIARWNIPFFTACCVSGVSGAPFVPKFPHLCSYVMQ